MSGTAGATDDGPLMAGMTGTGGLADWRWCPRCRHRLARRGEPGNPCVQCSRCGFIKYDNPLPGTTGIVFRPATTTGGGSELLFLRRAVPPAAGLWDAVGGFVASGESAEECLRREAWEELNCGLAEVAPIGTFGSVYGDTGLRTLNIAFACVLEPGSRIRLSDENDAHAWFPADRPPQLAFPELAPAIRAAKAARAARSTQRSS
jgi:ADP-ribose pyrophosphatase YjhB (NUDIX family)